jgi:hypothetical protein
LFPGLDLQLLKNFGHTLLDHLKHVLEMIDVAIVRVRNVLSFAESL